MRGAILAALLTLASFASPIAAMAQIKGDAARGADLFDERCTMCHQREGGGQGPSLVGVVDRHAASLPGVNYSRALKAFNRTWTPAELDRFLTNPSGLVPGTAMPLVVPGAKDRADLIAYLASKDNRR